MTNQITLDVANQIIGLYDEAMSDIKGITDEELYAKVDELFGPITDDLTILLNQLIIYNNLQTQRRLLATKEEEKSKIIISRLMTRLGKMDYQSEDGKISGKRSTLREYTDKSIIPAELQAPVRASINARIQKGEKIEGVEPTRNVISFSIKNK